MKEARDPLRDRWLLRNCPRQPKRQDWSDGAVEAKEEKEPLRGRDTQVHCLSLLFTVDWSDGAVAEGASERQRQTSVFRSGTTSHSLYCFFWPLSFYPLHIFSLYLNKWSCLLFGRALGTTMWSPTPQSFDLLWRVWHLAQGGGVEGEGRVDQNWKSPQLRRSPPPLLSIGSQRSAETVILPDPILFLHCLSLVCHNSPGNLAWT